MRDELGLIERKRNLNGLVQHYQNILTRSLLNALDNFKTEDWTMSINNATPQDWDRLRKQHPPLEVPKPTIAESMKQTYIDLAQEEFHAEMMKTEWYQQHVERKRMEEFNERWGNAEASFVYIFDEEEEEMSKEELEAYIFDDDEDVVNSPNHYNNGSKHDEHKARMSLIPPKALLEVGMVLTEGAKKYGDHNWKQLDSLQERYTSAALRHMMAHMAGETYDDETNLSHLAHAICCLMFKLEIEIKEAGE